MHEAEMESANLGCPLAIWHMQVANTHSQSLKIHKELTIIAEDDFVDLNKQKIRSLTQI